MQGIMLKPEANIIICECGDCIHDVIRMAIDCSDANHLPTRFSFNYRNMEVKEGERMYDVMARFEATPIEWPKEGEPRQ